MRQAVGQDEAGESDTGQAPLPVPPAALLDGASLFLDLDGTLLELMDDPSHVVADDALRTLLSALADRLDGRLAVVSGRSLRQIDRILGPLANDIALSGSHGCECRIHGVTDSAERPAPLDEVARHFHAFAAARDGILVEEKTLGIGLHYRGAADVAEAARHIAAGLAQDLGLKLQDGKMMVELRAAGDKGQGIRRLMEHPPMAGDWPVFIGDDVTDEAGFAAVGALGGVGILVGERRPTAALYHLADPNAVRLWLTTWLERESA